MNAQDALKISLNSGQMVGLSYLTDLTDEELMKRAAPGINHINWQVGHLVTEEHEMMSHVAPDLMPALPEGFASTYTRETVGIDDPARFFRKDVLLATYHAQRAGTLAALARVTAEELDDPTPEKFQAYAPTVGALFEMQGAHWLMHCGQWAVVRRQLGKPPLF